MSLLAAAISRRPHPARPHFAGIADTAYLATFAAADDRNGILISGFSTSDILRIDKITGMTYAAYSPWASDSDPFAGGLPWTNNFEITNGNGVTTDYWPTHYATAAAAEAAAIASPIYLTGATSYIYWLLDPSPSDNRAGLSIRITQL